MTDRIGSRLGHYRIENKIGEGGMGEVYLARDETLGRSVAIKLISAQHLAQQAMRTQFKSEALALSRLNHSHIATVHEFGSEGDLDFLVMEYIEGPTLDARIADTPMLEKDVIRIGRQIADGLAEAHEHGVIHRDLKPANIKIAKGGQAKILDFGLAMLQQPIAEMDRTAPMAPESFVAGTLAYMSPEVLRGQEPSAASDVWSLGVTLHQAAARKLPYLGNTGHEISSAILQDDRNPLPDSVSPPLCAVIDRCLESDPELRYKNAREVAIALEAVQSGTGVAPAVNATKAPPRWIWAAGAVVILAIVLAALGPLRGLLDDGALVADQVASVVALPSEVIGSEDDGFLTDAVPRNLSAQLSRLPGLATKLPPSSTEVAGLSGDLTRVADAYDVHAFVLSTIAAESEQLVLSIQLVAAGSRDLLWGNEYQGTRAGYISLIREAAAGLCEALRPSEAFAAGTEKGERPGNSEAELALQRGLYHLNFFLSRYLDADFQNASDSFHRALQLDPSLAEAAAAISQIEILSMTRGTDPAVALTRAETWAQEALRRDPDCSQAWQQLSNIEDMNPAGDPLKSLEYALKSVHLDPHNHHAYQNVGNTVLRSSTQLAIDAYRLAGRENPLDLAAPAVTAGLLGLLGEYDQAIEDFDRVLRIESQLPQALSNKLVVLCLVGDMESAAAIVATLEQMDQQRQLPPGMYTKLRHVFDFASAGQAGDVSTATDAMDQIASQARGEGPPQLFWKRGTQTVAPLLARYGQSELALQVLQRRVELGVSDPYDMLRWNPSLQVLQDDAGYEQVLDSAQAGFDRVVAVFDAARDRGELVPDLDAAIVALQRRLEAE